MAYSTVADMNELVIYSDIDEFQHHSVKWGKNKSQ